MTLPLKQLSVFGLGYVGSVSAACFARSGWTVAGVDVHEAKVDLILAGKPPVIEKDLGEIIKAEVDSGRLRATTDAREAVLATDISMVCVGTPSRANGSLDTGHLANVCEAIGAALRDKTSYHVVVIRSTIVPGTMRNLVLPTLERVSGKRAGVDFGLANNPEFLRESTAVDDFYKPPKTVIGGVDERSRDAVAALYEGIDAPLILTMIEIAEMVKYADNAWHAIKVAFGNEIGNLCKPLAIDSHAVMDIFCQDRKLNLSPYYLKPGFAFGGSCLPKDLRALVHVGRSLDLSLPLLESVLPSNRSQVERAIEMVVAKERRRVGVLGFSFKAGTDDLRESPLVELVERLIGKGFDLRLYDRNVSLARLVGANQKYIIEKIPHISRIMADRMEDVLEHADVIVIGNNDGAFHDVPSRLRSDQFLIDMVRLPSRGDLGARYDGINW
jgi:GDP-mannose 6-dehydrogenase